MRSVPAWQGKTDDSAIPDGVKLRERFEAILADKMIPEPNSGCWIWIGASKPEGYGHICMDQKYIGAHRLSYIAYKGMIPNGYVVCHKCDVPACVNPDHLWLGKQSDNLLDCVKKGRHKRKAPVGESHGVSKLSEENILEIRNSPRFYGSGRLLAKKFNVLESHISLIRARKFWGHI